MKSCQYHSITNPRKSAVQHIGIELQKRRSQLMQSAMQCCARVENFTSNWLMTPKFAPEKRLKGISRLRQPE